MENTKQVQVKSYDYLEIHEAEAYPDHIQMLVSKLYRLIVSSFMGYLKGKSSLMIFIGNAYLKYKYEYCKFSFQVFVDIESSQSG